MTAAPKPPTKGWITFVQNRLPALLDGEYTLDVQLQVVNTDPDAQSPSDQAYIHESFSEPRRFAVKGPRFSLDPSLIHDVFPANRSQGEFSDVLPHVAFTNATLPWQRSTDGSDGVPWLALLVLHSEDGVADAVAAKVGDLQRQEFAPNPGSTQTRPSTLPDRTASYADLRLEYGEAWSDSCRILDVPVEVFKRIAPAVSDLAWLAHVRTITAAAPGGDAASVQSPDAGTASVVVANRLPKNNDECTVHLVSLENMSEILPRIAEDGAYQAAAIPVHGGPDAGKPADAVRLVSMKSWRFRPVTPKETFEGYLEHVSPGPLQRPVLPDAGHDADRAVADAFEMGFTALDHHTRLGDRTVSWVRGPLLPYAVSRTPIVPIPDPSSQPLAEPLVSADEAMRYDPATGMLDASYSAAWVIGRLAALQNTSFALALYDWKRETAKKTVLALEREYLTGALGGALPAVGKASHGLDLLRGAMQLVASRVAPALARPGGSPEATASASLRLRRSLFDRHRAVLADRQALASIHADTELPQAIVAWLDRLRALHGVPFDYLVPDEAMLPPESIRFFQVDPSWIDALVEGALSLGSSTAGDAAHDAVLRPKLAATVPVETRSGFLLRSGVVAGWPKLRVTAYDVKNEPLAAVRVEPLSSTVLLAVFAGTLAAVDLSEPPIGLHFGVQNDKPLRYVTVPPGAPPGTQPGDQISDRSAGPVPLRADGFTVAITPHAAKVEAALNAAHADDEPGTTTPRPFTTAELSLQLVEGVQEFRFVHPSAEREAPSA